MKIFLRLGDRFRPIAHDNYFKLLDNYTAAEYLLNKKQYKLILNSLDGTKTTDGILKEFNKSDRLGVQKCIKELEKIQAIENSSKSRKRFFVKDYPVPYLESVLWDITSLCNLGCAHCYVGEYLHQAKGNDLTTNEAYSLIREMASMNIQEVSLTGGEPLIRKDLKDIIYAIISNGVRLSAIFTNGILVNKDFVDFLERNIPYPRNKFCIRISLDGMTPESNAALRGNKDNSVWIFNKMTESIRRFADAGYFVSVGTCVHRFNVHEIPEMYSFVKDLGVSKWRLAVPKPVGNFLKNRDNIMADWKDILRAYRQLIDLHLREVKIIDDERISPLRIGIEDVFHTEFLTRTLNAFQRQDLVCFYHKNHCSIKANGDVVPCGYFDDIIAGNVRRGGLRSAWESKTMQKIKHIKVSEVKECRGCKLLHYCGTGCRAVAKQINGSILSKDPYACQQIPFFKRIVTHLMGKYKRKCEISEKCYEFSVAEY